jgi:hypothetical protein
MGDKLAAIGLVPSLLRILWPWVYAEATPESSAAAYMPLKYSGRRMNQLQCSLFPARAVCVCMAGAQAKDVYSMVGRSDEEAEGNRYQMKEKGSDKGERARGNHTRR